MKDFSLTVAVSPEFKNKLDELNQTRFKGTSYAIMIRIILMLGLTAINNAHRTGRIGAVERSS